MKRATAVLLPLLLATLACRAPTGERETTALQSAPQPVELATGTSFGMCAGYCVTELVVEADAVTLTETGHPSFGLAPRTRSLPLPAAEARRMHELADSTVLAELAGVHGCPDCADGGAEWIELRTPARAIRVTFEHGVVLPRIAQLQAALRLQRARFQ